MPANRLRNENWRGSLEQIHARGGSIELAVERRKDPLSRKRDEGPLREPPRDLLWRVHLLGLDKDTLTVETPGTMGSSLTLEPGLKLVGVMAIGQSRWMFHSRVIGQASPSGPGAVPLKIEMPDHVERCTRRAQQRISTAELDLPDVYAWNLRDPATAVPAEVGCRAQVADLLAKGQTSDAPLDDPGDIKPDLGLGLRAKLANIGGGGVGLTIGKDDRGSVEDMRLYWLRIDLRPVVPAPVSVTARLAHSTIDAMQTLYAGMAFDFVLNPPHKDFVIDQMKRYADHLQKTSQYREVPET